MGLLLGSIVAPPDALAATSVLQKLKIPKRVVTILQGESLVNDAASLILFRFAVAAVVSREFSFADAGMEFIFASLSGIFIGCAVAGLLYLLHRFMPTGPSIDTVVSVATPYMMYILAEKAGASGVLSVVSGGFLLSYHSSKTLNSRARLQMLGVWKTLVFILNGLVFILVGLQLPLIVNRLGNISLPLAILLGFGISVTVMVIRMLWMFPVTYLPRLLSPSLKLRDPYPGWQTVFLMGWCGMRGIVTLASALTMPLMLADSSVFPFRDLILFEAFTVIIFTLVIQGLALPFLIKNLNISIPEKDDRQESELMKHLAAIALRKINDNYAEESVRYAPFVRQKEKYERLAKVHYSATNGQYAQEFASIEKYHEMKQEVIAVRRNELALLSRQHVFSEDLLRKKEFELDHEQISMTPYHDN